MNLEPYGRHLPIFPYIAEPITESAFERIVERLMDRADASLMRHDATQAQYNRWTKALDSWAKRVTLAR